MATCTYCGADIDPRDRDAHRRVEGWAPMRTIRRLDLANFDRRDLNTYACGDCVRIRKIGVAVGQGTLL